MEDLKRLEAFPCSFEDLEAALKDATARGENDWNCRPVGIIERGGKIKIVVEIQGDYPFCENELRDRMKKYD